MSAKQQHGASVDIEIGVQRRLDKRAASSWRKTESGFSV
jgi:hypothetical protein